MQNFLREAEGLTTPSRFLVLGLMYFRHKIVEFSPLGLSPLVPEDIYERSLITQYDCLLTFDQASAGRFGWQ